MKLLLDSCVWGKAKAVLVDDGHDVVWVGDWKRDPGDREILDFAYREGRILVTLDKDFGELAIIRKIPHSGIIRLVSLSVKYQAKACLHIISHYSEDLTKGAIITVEANRIRIRPPEN